MVWNNGLVEYLTKHRDEIAHDWVNRRPSDPSSPYLYSAIIDQEADGWTEKSAAQMMDMLVKSLKSDVKEDIEPWAKFMGSIRARQGIDISHSLERFTAYRQVLWRYLFRYYKAQGINESPDEFFRVLEHFADTMNLMQERYCSHFFAYKEQIIEAQRTLIGELAVPVMPITEDVCVLPLLGTIDTHRAKVILETTLQRVMEQQARYLVIDVSGVMMIDTMVAQRLFEIVKALRLMGTTSILSGIQPDVAQTMVQLGIQVSVQVETMNNLRQALRRIEDLKRADANGERLTRQLFLNYQE